MFNRVAVTAAFVLGCLATSAFAAEDWPKWMGPRGDNISKEKVIARWPADGPKQLWTAQVGDGHSSPVAHKGLVYLFMLDNSGETLTCFNAESGKQTWKQSYPIRYKPQYPGTRATPTIEKDRIYTLGEAGDLLCRELDGGKEVWRVNVLQVSGAKPLMWGCASSPLVVDDRVYVQTGDGGPIAIAVDKGSGKIAWKSEGATKAGFATLVYADVPKGKPQLIIFAGRGVGGIDPENGRTIWGDKFQTQFDVNAATPLYSDGNVLFTAEYSGGRATKYALTDKSWKKVWESRDLRSKFQPPILDDGVVYGNSSGTLVCLDWKTGKLLWQAKDRNLQLGAGGSLVRAADDKLITMSERGRLGLVEATPKGWKLLASAQLFDAQQVWSTPLVYDGKLYCKGGDTFVCLDVSPEK